MMVVAMAAAAAVLGSTTFATPSIAKERDYAPINRPGPDLSIPPDKLAKSLNCTADAARATQKVALFVPGTSFTPEVNYGWNWFPALRDRGIPYCSVQLPRRALGDAQISAEYVVHAIRQVHRVSGHQVALVGHSQGGLVARFALRFWPDLRPMVDDYISFGATNHGGITGDLACVPAVGCPPATSQQRLTAKFVEATNSGQETFGGISYTNVYTRADEIAQPNLNDHGTSSLHGPGRITNVAVQDLCPLSLATEHLAVGTYDPAAYALAIDALTHDGPATLERTSQQACATTYMPGVDPNAFAGNYASLVTSLATGLASFPRATREPSLKPYVFS